MSVEERAKLEQLGLSPSEATIYLALLKHGPLGATDLAAVARIPRTSVYPALCSLADKGMVESGAAHGSRFSAIAPEHAFTSLIVREKEAFLEREQLAEELVEEFSPLAEKSEAVPEDLIQIIRNPRAVAERLERLQLETENQVDAFVKPPFFNRSGNSAQEKVMRRGVSCRGVYERIALEDPAVKPFLEKWLACGEEARVYDGVLPHKMAIFDSKVVLMPLIMPGKQTRTLLIRNLQLAQTFALAFESVWERSEPLSSTTRRRPVRRTRGPTNTALYGPNHERKPV